MAVLKAVMEKAMTLDGLAALDASEVRLISTRSGNGMTGWEALFLDTIETIETELRDHGPKIPGVYCATVSHCIQRAKAIEKALRRTYEIPDECAN